MPIIVFGNRSNISEKKIDTSVFVFVQKPYSRSIYLESNTEQNIDLKNQNRKKNSPDPLSIREVCSKKSVDYNFKKDIDFNEVELKKITFVEVNYQPAINEHLTTKKYVDNAIDEISIVRNNQDEDFKNQKLTDINSMTLHSQAVNDNQVIT